MWALQPATIGKHAKANHTLLLPLMGLLGIEDRPGMLDPGILTYVVLDRHKVWTP